jgi:hypothetical protein
MWATSMQGQQALQAGHALCCDAGMLVTCGHSRHNKSGITHQHQTGRLDLRLKGGPMHPPPSRPAYLAHPELLLLCRVTLHGSLLLPPSLPPASWLPDRTGAAGPSAPSAPSADTGAAAAAAAEASKSPQQNTSSCSMDTATQPEQQVSRVKTDTKGGGGMHAGARAMKMTEGVVLGVWVPQCLR